MEMLIDGAQSVEAFDQLFEACVTKDGKPRSTLFKKTQDLLKALGDAEAQATVEVGIDLSGILIIYQQRAFDFQVAQFNDLMYRLGQACINHYEAIKSERRKLDFSDLEIHAWRLLKSENTAAYLHARMDARYKHILIDEFQDTNPLQWQIVRAWLDAYAEDALRPTVFIVGDPKQSIYRFRRAEPRVFEAARQLLLSQGAVSLKTSSTWRNAVAIVEVLNQALEANPLYQPQATVSKVAGCVWRLPLVAKQQASTQSTEWLLRDPLREAAVEEEDQRRSDEAMSVAQALRLAHQGTVDQSPIAWSQMMILVRTRTHLADYERGLRQAGIPFVSSRAGGLLDALEIYDLMALLRWLTMPADNLALAHVLKSPIGALSDQDLMRISRAGEGSWWQRLERLFEQGEASEDVQRIHGLLNQWQVAARSLPVHDVLDSVLHQGQLRQRYAVSTPSETRAQVLANLDAFIALSLQLDAGRYPSLARFLDQLQRLQRGQERDAPDEAEIDTGIDAVRIMTIHGAKGLEAEVVVLMDANAGESKKDSLGILCEWPEDAVGPTHFSVYGKEAERGLARAALFQQEEAFREQEQWNLLYVAATRAKSILIISGSLSGKEQAPAKDSWYHRLLAVPEFELSSSLEAPQPAKDHFVLPLFQPVPQPPQNTPDFSEDNAATLEGKRLHALMERLTQDEEWPVRMPSLLMLARWLACTLEEASIATKQASCILGSEALVQFFDPARYTYARNELELMHEGKVMRLDRVVILNDQLWILDYKRNNFEWQQDDYQEQLETYRSACSVLFPGRAIQTALITVDGRLWQAGSEGLPWDDALFAAD